VGGQPPLKSSSFVDLEHLSSCFDDFDSATTNASEEAAVALAPDWDWVVAMDEAGLAEAVVGTKWEDAAPLSSVTSSSTTTTATVTSGVFESDLSECASSDKGDGDRADEPSVMGTRHSSIQGDNDNSADGGEGTARTGIGSPYVSLTRQVALAARRLRSGRQIKPMRNYAIQPTSLEWEKERRFGCDKRGAHTVIVAELTKARRLRCEDSARSAWTTEADAPYETDTGSTVGARVGSPCNSLCNDPLRDSVDSNSTPFDVSEMIDDLAPCMVVSQADVHTALCYDVA